MRPENNVRTLQPARPRVEFPDPLDRDVATGIGDALRGAREEQGRTLEEAARATRVRAEYLGAIEDEDFPRLGGDVYAKGFIATYARWLDLDPEPLLERYRSEVQRGGYDPHALLEHPVAKSPSRGIPTGVLWTVVGVVAVVLALGVAGTLGGRAPEPAADPLVDATEIETSASPSPPPGSEPAASPSPSPTPSPSPSAVDLVLLMEAESWMEIRIDDEVVFQGTMGPGDSREFRDPDAVRLWLGNAGGVKLVLNGREIGSPGGPGQVWRGVCTLEGCAAQ